jgi:hypothetical protein
VVESQPSKLLVAGSIPVSRSRVDGTKKLHRSFGAKERDLTITKGQAKSLGAKS